MKKLHTNKSMIVQVYAGEQSSFAVDKYSTVYAWGHNKNNCLLLNAVEIGIVKSIVDQPMECRLPEYFIKPGKINVVPNNSHGFDYYKAMKPVFSEAHKAQEELQKVQDKNIEMRRQIKDLK